MCFLKHSLMETKCYHAGFFFCSIVTRMLNCVLAFLLLFLSLSYESCKLKSKRHACIISPVDLHCKRNSLIIHVNIMDAFLFPDLFAWNKMLPTILQLNFINKSVFNNKSLLIKYCDNLQGKLFIYLLILNLGLHFNMLQRKTDKSCALWCSYFTPFSC